MSEQDGTPAGELQIVVFRIGSDTYGVDIGCVREIITLRPITRVPGTSEFVEVVLNLRGHVIPVMNLWRRMGLPPSDPSPETRIMVVEVGGHTLGFLVDAVTEVLHIGAHLITSSHALTRSVNAEFLRGVAKLDQRLIILLDLERLLQAPESPTRTELDSQTASVLSPEQ